MAFFHGMIAQFIIAPTLTIWLTLIYGNVNEPAIGMASFYSTFAVVFGMMLTGGIIFFIGRKDGH